MLDVFRLVNTTNWKKWCKEFPYFVPNTICQRKKKVPKRIVIHAWVQFLITSKSRYICRVSWAAVREVLKSLLSISFNAFWLTSGVLSPLLNAILYTSFALSMKWMHCLQASFFIMGMCLHARLPQFFFPRPVKNQLQLSWDYPAGIFLSFLQLHILVEALRTCIITRYSCAAEVNSTVVTRRCCYTPFAVAVYHCFRGFAMFTCSRRLVILLAIRPAGSSAVGTPATFSTLLSQRGVIASAYLEYLCEVFTNYITKQ